MVMRAQKLTARAMESSIDNMDRATFIRLPLIMMATVVSGVRSLMSNVREKTNKGIVHTESDSRDVESVIIAASAFRDSNSHASDTNVEQILQRADSIARDDNGDLSTVRS